MRSGHYYDVVVLGGGLAGLTVALQLKQARPRTSILVVERHRHPVPEAAFKVGESTVEIGAHYFAEVLGLRDHLSTRQLRKAGLRFYFTAGDNQHIADRIEIGSTSFPPTHTYQIDRGRFEMALAHEVRSSGAEFVDDCRVRHVRLGAAEHAVEMLRRGSASTVRARWVVDASGRPGVLKRQLGLAKRVSHDVNAAWFRVADDVDIGEWSQDAEWRRRVPAGLRRLATNHLMGSGYWVWVIPLASGSTSFGIVADARLHPFERINRFDRAMEWLAAHEPECARVVGERRDRVQDFLVLRHFAHSCTRVFSADRWATTGEAGVFLDPFYSPGSDFIAMSNTFITDLVVRELSGEGIAARADAHNRTLLSVFARFLHVFELQYPIMGNALVMTAKVVWDLATYWGVPALLFRNDKLCDVSFMSSVRREVTQFERLSAQMQELFRDWAEVEESAWHPTLVNVLRAEWLFELQCALTTRFSDDELREKLADNVAGFEALAAALFRKAGQHPPTGLLPATVSNGAGGGPAAQLDAILSGDAEAAREWKDRPASVKVASPA